MSTEELGNGTHVIKFFADWCGPCKLYAPVFERAAAQRPEINFHTVDIDEDPGIRDEFQVQSVPTTIIVVDGDEVSRMPGAKSSKMLDTFLDGVLS